jgi:protocatechuate 3,4-dioxygenase beta subunit
MADEKKTMPRSADFSRRQMIAVLGASTLLLLTGCGADDVGVPVDETGTCPPTPKQDEGQQYVDHGLMQSDIVGGQKGVALDLWIKVLTARSCEPIANAAVDVWSANAQGEYSETKPAETAEAAGPGFLRGLQMTDSTGFVKFKMIYPGWYDGRASHVNVKVRVGGAATETTYTGGNLIHTAQLFFPPEINEAVRNVYTDNTNPFVNNDKDRIYTRQNGDKAGVALEGSIEAGYAGTFALDVTV